MRSGTRLRNKTLRIERALFEVRWQADGHTRALAADVPARQAGEQLHRREHFVAILCKTDSERCKRTREDLSATDLEYAFVKKAGRPRVRRLYPEPDDRHRLFFFFI